MRHSSPLTVFRHAVFETDRFRLRPATERDQPQMFAWRSDPETARYLSGLPPASQASQWAWYQRVRGDARRAYHIMEDKGALHEPLGFTSLVRQDGDDGAAEWGLVMGHRRGHGLVKLIAPLFCHCALEVAGFRTLYASINPGNQPAQRKMQQIGAVVVEGPHRYRKDGEILFEIRADRFADAIRDRQPFELDLADHLRVRVSRVDAPDAAAGRRESPAA